MQASSVRTWIRSATSKQNAVNLPPARSIRNGAWLAKREITDVSLVTCDLGYVIVMYKMLEKAKAQPNTDEISSSDDFEE